MHGTGSLPGTGDFVRGRGAKLSGYVSRGYGSQAHPQENGTIVGVTSTTHVSGALGQVQGDAIRKIFGRFTSYAWPGWTPIETGNPQGAFANAADGTAEFTSGTTATQGPR